MIVKNCTLISPLWCDKNESVLDVAKKLKEHRQRRIIVVEDSNPIGIISTTDMNNMVVAEDKVPSTIKASDIMTSPIFIVADINEDLNNIYNKMLEHGTFYVPVTQEKKLIGVLTFGELKRRVLEKVNNDRKS